MKIKIEDLEETEEQFQRDLMKGVKIARENNMNLTKFKIEITNIFKIINNEDQWTFDYESYLLSISNGIYESPEEWGKEHFKKAPE